MVRRKAPQLAINPAATHLAPAMIGEAAWWSTIGCGAAAVALAATLAERRRIGRRNLDAVGFVPWTGVFLAAVLTACVAFGLAARAWLVG